jgi:hypothetical protein
MFALPADTDHQWNESARQQHEGLRERFEAAYDSLELLVSFAPGIGWAVSGYKMHTGKDLLGREISTFERVMEGVGFFAPIAIPYISEVASAVLSKVADIVQIGSHVGSKMDDLARLGSRMADDVYDPLTRQLKVLDNVTCFVAGTPVHVMGGESGVWYASAVGALAAGVAGFVVAQRRRKKRHEEVVDQVFAEQYSNDANTRFSDELDTIAAETPAFEQLCDQLFHGEDLNGWLDQR